MRMAGRGNTGNRRARVRAGPVRRAVRVCTRGPTRGERSEREGERILRETRLEGPTFLFPGDIYLGTGGRRGPRFA